MLVFLAVFSIIFVGIVIVFFLNSTKKQMQQEFKALSYDIMQKNQQSFFQWVQAFLSHYQEGSEKELDNKKKEIEALLTPLKETLAAMQENTRQIEKQREGAYVGLMKQIEALVQSEGSLQKQTQELATALKSPTIRGSWGQIHLRRVVELAGLSNNCDFFEQVSIADETGAYRPDLLIKLPGGRNIIVDAKTPFEAFWQALQQQSEEEKKRKFLEHAGSLRKHIKELSNKNYYKQFPYCFDYVILFLPAEAFFSAAIEADSELTEMAASNNIILATPTTLIAILRAIALCWRQENLSKSAEEIAQAGKELYERLFVMHGHFSKLGKSLSLSVDAYNQTVTSLESRVFVSARKLQELGATMDKKELFAEKIEKIAKTVQEKEEELSLE